MGTSIEKAGLLIEQKRFELAIKELQQSLVADPDEARTHALLAVCLRQLDRNAEALKAAQQAVALGPDDAYGHYVLAGVYLELDRYKEAETSIRAALSLEPDDADYYTRLASIQIQLRQWEASLESSEQALELEPTNSAALNLRSVALNQLNRQDEAGEATEGALAANPEDPMAHAARGWHELRHGNRDMAMTHFKEALRLDGSHVWARQGLAETLKARNPIYRLMLVYFLWLGRLEPKLLWGFILGGYVLSKVLREFAAANPQWAPYAWGLLGVYFTFCLMTWIADPLFNLLLRLHPLGRVALSRQQIQSANWFGGSLLLAGVSLVFWWALDAEPFLPLAIVAVLMVIPISSSLGVSSDRARKILLAYTGVLGAIGAWIVASAIFAETGLALAIPLGVFLIGVVTFIWVANIVNTRH